MLGVRCMGREPNAAHKTPSIRHAFNFRPFAVCAHCARGPWECRPRAARPETPLPTWRPTMASHIDVRLPVYGDRRADGGIGRGRDGGCTVRRSAGRGPSTMPAALPNRLKRCRLGALWIRFFAKRRREAATHELAWSRTLAVQRAHVRECGAPSDLTACHQLHVLRPSKPVMCCVTGHKGVPKGGQWPRQRTTELRSTTIPPPPAPTCTTPLHKA